MQQMAEKMGCRFVYAIVPAKTVEDFIPPRKKIATPETFRKAAINQ